MMEKEQKSPRSKGTKEHLASLREKSKIKEMGNERKEDETTATNKGKNKDPEKKDHSADHLETALNLRNLDFKDKNANLENSLTEKAEAMRTSQDSTKYQINWNSKYGKQQESHQNLKYGRKP